ncbi:MAG: RadC family protein, partial [Bacteroidota bacterium]
SDLKQKPRVTCSRDAFNAISTRLNDLHHEEFWILLLNRANEVFGRERVSIGGTNATVVDLKLVFKVALDARAAAFIAIHNHPSGNLQPSRADIELTERLKQAGKIFDLPLLDHLIISERGYYSFADEGSL